MSQIYGGIRYLSHGLVVQVLKRNLRDLSSLQFTCRENLLSVRVFVVVINRNLIIFINMNLFPNGYIPVIQGVHHDGYTFRVDIPAFGTDRNSVGGAWGKTGKG